MASEAEVEAMCDQLVRAVEAMLDHTSSPQIRQDALKYCENFKEQSPPALGVQCGLVLSQPRPEQPVIRHFGLRLMEEIIKLRWNDMTGPEKVFVKDNAMRLMAEGSADILAEARHVKDAQSRIVVEIAKREWPQHWPSFLTELEALCSKGFAQTELVMFVLLRLVEDVAVLQTLEQNQRRKEIHQALNAEMNIIFAFLQGLLERHYQGYLVSKDQDKDRHSKVCQAVLEAYNAFVEWVPMTHIVANEHYLLKCLCHLLTDEQLQLHAAECLLSIVSWRAGRIQDRALLLVLFRTDMIMPLFRAVEAAEIRQLQERHYVFLKKMVQILVELGAQLCAVWSAKECKNEPKQPPDNFETYLNAMLAFSRHPSIMVNFYANNLWGQLARHADVSKDPKFLAILPKWLEVACKKVVKVGFPSKQGHPSCAYSQIDFETDEEFSSQFGKCRIILLEILKTVSSSNPWLPYRLADEWLRSVLTKPLLLDSKDGKAKPSSPSVLELDAIHHVLDAVLSRCCFEEQTAQAQQQQQHQNGAENNGASSESAAALVEASKMIMQPAAELLKMCLDFQSNDPILISSVLSCVSSLFVVATVTPGALMPILNQIFACITFGSTASGLPAELTQEMRALRRHGCALLVKIGMRHPKTLVPVLDHLRSTIVDDLHMRRGALHKMEYVTLVEALVLISNQVGSYEAQSNFLAALAQPVLDQIRSLEPVFRDAESLMAHIGLTCSPGIQGVETFQKNRANIAFCIQFLLAVSRRTSCPNDLEKCKAGGFVDPLATFKGGEGGNQLIALRCPGAAPCCSVLRQIFMLVKSFCDMWAFSSKLAPAYAKALDMLDLEKANVLGVSSRSSSEGPQSNGSSEDQSGAENGIQTSSSTADNNSKKTSDLQRVQCFIFEQFENLYHLLAQYCVNFGHEFYRQPGLAEGVVSQALQGLTSVPDFRLRAVVRTFLKSLINKCPASHFSAVLAPVLTLFCPYVLTRLSDRWDQVIKMREDPNFDPDAADSAPEVVADVIACQLTREYLDVVKAVLTSGGGSDLNNAKVTNLNEPVTDAKTSSTHNLTLSDLGTLVMQHESLGQCVTQTLLRALLWPDSPSSARSSALLEAIMPQLAKSDQMGSADAAHVMFTILSAIHKLGQHEANYITLTQLAVTSYELLRPKHASVAEVLAQVPGCNPDEMKKFDDRVMQIFGQREAAAAAAQNNGGGANGANNPQPPTVGSRGGDKASKAMFKKLISRFTGVDVAQMFRKEVVIKNLPTLQLLKQREKTPSLVETEAKDIGLSALFTSPAKNGNNGNSSAGFAAVNGNHATTKSANS